MDQETKPMSRSFILLAIVLACMIASAFIPARWLGIKPAVKTHTAIDFTKLKSVTEFTKDTNGNGQLSWKELVASTDGTPSTSTTSQNQKTSKETLQALNDPNNLTTSFSKNLLLTSTYLKNNNIADRDLQQKALDGILAEEADKLVSKKYLYKDIKIATTENKDTVRAYGNEMAKILQGMITEQKIKDDFSGLEFYTQTKDTQYLEPLITDAAKIATIEKKLLTISVPPSATIYHLIVINKVTYYKDMLTNMSKAATDPIRATIAMKNYFNDVVSTLVLYKTLSDYFNQKNIIYTTKEAGYLFTVGYTL